MSGSSEGIFDSSVFRQELSGEIVGGDVLVMRRESVPSETEWTNPQFASNVDLTIRVEDSATGWLARDGLVKHRREIHSFLERSVELKRIRISVNLHSPAF